jgi:hypothetical protein
MKTKLFPALLIAGLGCSLAHAQAPTALRGGFVDGADVLLHVDMLGLGKSAFSKAVEAQQPADVKAKNAEKKAKFLAATGLGDEDVLVAVMSADLEKVDFKNQDPKQMETLPAVVAFQLAKPITMAQLKAGLEMIMEDAGKKPTLAEETVDGLKLLVAKPASPDEGGPQSMFGALAPDGKTVLMGLNTASIKGGLARIAEGKTSNPSPDMGNAIKSLGNKQFRLAVVLPQVLRDELKKSMADMAQDPMGAMFMPLASTTALLVSLHTQENLDVGLQLDVGDNAKAQQAAGMLQGMLMPMIMMGAGQQLGQNAMGVAQKLKIAAEGTSVGVSINLTPDDVKKDPNAAAPGMMMPGTMDGM